MISAFGIDHGEIAKGVAGAMKELGLSRRYASMPGHVRPGRKGAATWALREKEVFPSYTRKQRHQAKVRRLVRGGGLTRQGEAATLGAIGAGVGAHEIRQRKKGKR